MFNPYECFSEKKGANEHLWKWITYAIENDMFWCAHTHNEEQVPFHYTEHLYYEMLAIRKYT